MTVHLDTAHRRLSLNPHDPVFYANPAAAYRTVLEAGPMWYWEELGLWCIFGYREVDALLRDRRFGREVLHVASRADLGWPEPTPHTSHFDAVDAHSLLEREPPVHTRLRALISRAFVPRRVQPLVPHIEALANELVDEFPATPFDLLTHYATPLPVRVIARLLGVPESMAPTLLRWSHDMVAMYGVGRTYDTEVQADRAAREFAMFIRETVAARRGAPGDDLLSVLMAAEEQGDRLSEAELVSTAILLLNAGHEATVHALGNAVYLMLSNGVDRGLLLGDADAMARLVEESLRVAPPLHLFKRYALEAVELHGVVLQKGDQVAAILGATGQDASVTSCPEAFNSQRDRSAHISFGAGIHFCLGAPLARLELQIALRVLFTRYPTLRLVESPMVRNSWHFHGFDQLLVTLR